MAFNLIFLRHSGLQRLSHYPGSFRCAAAEKKAALTEGKKGSIMTVMLINPHPPLVNKGSMDFLHTTICRAGRSNR